MSTRMSKGAAAGFGEAADILARYAGLRRVTPLGGGRQDEHADLKRGSVR